MSLIYYILIIVTLCACMADCVNMLIVSTDDVFCLFFLIF